MCRSRYRCFWPVRGRSENKCTTCGVGSLRLDSIPRQFQRLGVAWGMLTRTHILCYCRAVNRQCEISFSSTTVWFTVCKGSKIHFGASQVALCGKEPSCQHRRSKRSGYNHWLGKTPWRGTWQPAPVFLPGESQGPGGLQSTGSQRLEHGWSDLACMQALRF